MSHSGQPCPPWREVTWVTSIEFTSMEVHNPQRTTLTAKHPSQRPSDDIPTNVWLPLGQRESAPATPEQEIGTQFGASKGTALANMKRNDQRVPLKLVFRAWSLLLKDVLALSVGQIQALTGPYLFDEPGPLSRAGRSFFLFNVLYWSIKLNCSLSGRCYVRILGPDAAGTSATIASEFQSTSPHTSTRRTPYGFLTVDVTLAKSSHIELRTGKSFRPMEPYRAGTGANGSSQSLCL